MSGNKKENTELQYEAERDYVKRFIAEQYVSRGYYIHFHRNIEIYGVVKGEVYVTIAGESCTLKEGQIAVINGFESHSYEIDGEAEIFYFHVGTDYVRDFKQLYPNRKLPRWLLERKQNETIISQIKKVMTSGGKWSDLKKTGFVCSLFADIIDFYGLISSVPATESDNDLVSQAVQYIYEHYAEDLTLETLSRHFFMSPKVFSRRISKGINCDLRIFVNDVRIQKAVQLLHMPENKARSVADVAFSCGFNNMVTFYRSYKRNFCYKKLPKPEAD